MALTRRPARCFVTMVLGVVTVFGVVQHWYLSQPERRKYLSAFYETFADWNASSEDPNQDCTLPKLDPFNPAILDYLLPPEPIRCRWPHQRLTLIKDGRLQFNQTALDESGYSQYSLWCHYQPMTRPEGDDEGMLYGPETPVTGKDVIEHEYVYVSCKNWWGLRVYSYIHAHPRDLHPKPAARLRMERKPSILVFGIDSLSRMNAIRYLPKTCRYLTSKMGAHVMLGMSRVADNTFPNVIAMLTGRSLPMKEIEVLPPRAYYDDYPLIWKKFSSASQYVTMLAEDYPVYTIFNLFRRGFRKPPTDHYLRPFWVAVHSLIMYRLSSAMCFGSVPKHVLQLEYLRDFVAKYQNVPYFAFSLLTEIGHDKMNMVGEADEDIAAFLRNLHEEGYLNDTILFFVADHGHRHSPIRQTVHGGIDANLPFSAIVLPQWIRNSFPEITQRLSTNSKRLTSHFDYYETFVDILHYAAGESLLGLGKPGITHRGHGYSLFQEIPLNRTCDTAGIPSTYCPCSFVEETELPVSDELVKMAAGVLEKELNFLISNHTSACAFWKLSQVKSAASSPPPVTQRALNTHYIRVVVQMEPAKALFEALVSLTISGEKSVGKVIDQISRIDRYRGQEKCVTTGFDTEDLRQYCYCL